MASKTALRRPLRPPKRRQTGQESPKTAKEAPKKPPNAPSRPKEAPKRPPRGLQEAPSRPQDCPKRLQEASFSSSYSYYCSSYSSSSSCSFSPACSPKAFRTDSGNTRGPIAWPSYGPTVGHIGTSTKAGGGGDSPQASSIIAAQFSNMSVLKVIVAFGTY